MVKVLFLGDIVGKPAREFISERLSRIKDEENIDFVIANGENAAGGSGITPHTARGLFSSGIDVLTSGDHIFRKKEVKEALETMDIIRPLNYGELAWGRGFLIKDVRDKKIAVINLVGRVFMNNVDCPFKSVRDILDEVMKETPIVIVDMHGEATSEKLAMGYFLAGKVSAVIGTHTHIPTADERIIDGYTAYITDVGMSGSFDSILGRDKYKVIERFITNLPIRFDLAHEDVRLQGVIITIDDSGKAVSIVRREYKKEV